MINEIYKTRINSRYTLGHDHDQVKTRYTLSHGVYFFFYIFGEDFMPNFMRDIDLEFFYSCNVFVLG